jgi:pimeloyl-ACP methyl ester carboxylesterase
VSRPESTADSVRSADGTPIAYDRRGDGPPVIVVGGAFSHRRFPQIVDLAERLAERFTTVAYDRRGRGDSGDARPYAVEREIEDLAAVVDAIGGRASIWGWSSAGVLALRASACGVAFDRIAVYEPPFFVDGDGRLPPPDFATELDRLVAEGRRGAAARHFMVNGMGVPGPVVAMMRVAPFWRLLKATAHTLPYDWAVMGSDVRGRSLRREEWAAVSAPVLVMAGEKSPAQLRSAARAIAGVLPAAEHQLLPGQSHNVSMKALAPALVPFLADARAPTPDQPTPTR